MNIDIIYIKCHSDSQTCRFFHGCVLSKNWVAILLSKRLIFGLFVSCILTLLAVARQRVKLQLDGVVSGKWCPQKSMWREVCGYSATSSPKATIGIYPHSPHRNFSHLRPTRSTHFSFQRFQCQLIPRFLLYVHPPQLSPRPTL